MNKISICKISKSYTCKQVLQEVSFEAHAGPGNITAILGPSGSGKSTLLRCLCKLESPDTGEINLHNKSIGMIFQQFHLWKHLSVLENCILAPLKKFKIDKQEIMNHAISLLAELGLNNKFHSLPNNLSGGEQQRVAIVRALMMHPEVLLFDEPTSALDPERTQNVVDIIHKLAKQKLILIIVTHDIHFAKLVANQVIFLDEGKVAEKTSVENQRFLAKSERFLQYLRH